jgi:hypothetical protein
LKTKVKSVACLWSRTFCHRSNGTQAHCQDERNVGEVRRGTQAPHGLLPGIVVHCGCRIVVVHYRIVLQAAATVLRASGTVMASKASRETAQKDILTCSCSFFSPSVSDKNAIMTRMSLS